MKFRRNLFGALVHFAFWAFILAGPGFSSVCVDCHGKLSGKPGEAVKRSRGSIHSRNGVSCHSCHGGNPDDKDNPKSPESGFTGSPKKAGVSKFCGHCHEAVWRQYSESAHGKTVESKGPSCVDCHGSHAVKRATMEIVNENFCGSCHSAESVGKIKPFFQESRKRIENLEKGTDDFKMEGFDTGDLEKILFSSGSKLQLLRHEIDMAELASAALGINASLEGIEKAHLAFRLEMGKRRIAGGIAVSIAFVLAFAAHLLRRRIERGKAVS